MLESSRDSAWVSPAGASPQAIREARAITAQRPLQKLRMKVMVSLWLGDVFAKIVGMRRLSCASARLTQSEIGVHSHRPRSRSGLVALVNIHSWAASPFPVSEHKRRGRRRQRSPSRTIGSRRRELYPTLRVARPCQVWRTGAALCSYRRSRGAVEPSSPSLSRAQKRTAPEPKLRRRERETRFELATSTLARLHSTTELLPQELLDRRSQGTARAISGTGVLPARRRSCQPIFTLGAPASTAHSKGLADAHIDTAIVARESGVDAQVQRAVFEETEAEPASS